MSSYEKSKLDQFDGITQDEYEMLTEVMKKEEFRKLFVEYCDEISDPENRKIYEAELIQLEKDRGVDIIFINPEPGFVIKTSVNGDKKCFINIAASDKVEKPSCEHIQNENMVSGSNWMLPHTLSPERHDYDKKKQKCIVYDVVFHQDTLKMAESDKRFRRMVIDIAVDAVKRSFNVEIDGKNLKFPNSKYKGLPKACAIRKRSELPEDYVESPIEQYLPPRPTENPENDFVVGNTKLDVVDVTDEYTTPKYKIVHRRDIDIQECVNDMHSKLDVALPNELVITVDLPLLRTTEDVTLDVTAKELVLQSDRPAKYKLKLVLPYEVNEMDGSAKFDKSKKKLIITLPVFRKEILIKPEEKISGNDLVNEIQENEKLSETMINVENVIPEMESFLNPNISYIFPPFTIEKQFEEENFIYQIKFPLKNVDPSSFETNSENENLKKFNSSFIHLKWFIIGTGYFPVHYSFYFKFIDNSSVSLNILSSNFYEEQFIVEIKANVKMDDVLYLAGIDGENLTEFLF